MRKSSLIFPSTMSDRGITHRLLAYVKTQQKAFIISAILMLSAVGFELLLPILFGEAASILGEPDADFNRILVIVAVSFVSLILSSLVQYGQTMMLQRAGQTIIYGVREEVFTHIEAFSLAQLHSVPVGKMVTRVTNDTNALNEMFTQIIMSLVKSVLMIVAVLIAMIIISPILSLYVMIIAPLVGVSAFIFRKFSRAAYREVRHNISNINAFLSENLSGMKITQVCNQEEKKLNEFRVHNQALKKSSLKEVFVFAVFRPFIYVLYMITIIIILWVGTKDNMAGGLVTYSILLVFYQFVERLFGPIQRIAEDFNIMQSAFASSERIFETLDTKLEIVDSPDARDLEHVKGDIEFKNVWFYYKEGEWVLKDVSFKINAGETVAFVGATGSGKTTILSLVVRNFDIQQGQILIDGIDIKKIKVASLRRHFGQMLQDVFLFSGTIESNIKMREEFTSDQVKEACHYVNANHFIEQLPKQYEEEVRERGNNFSSGQRQLLSFARTIIHRPAVMILDEATANIDAETELLIQDSLEKMMNIGTMIVVAHRLSTIQHADSIIVLQKGVIIEQGTHQNLLKQKGHYYKLYQLQYQDTEEHSGKET
ncbi:MAG: ABC transporter ATP-binding protein [Bacilli bacterium]